MEIIKELKPRVEFIGAYTKNHRQGLFLCPICKKKVEKKYSAGLRAKSCGCVKAGRALYKLNSVSKNDTVEKKNERIRALTKHKQEQRLETYPDRKWIKRNGYWEVQK